MDGLSRRAAMIGIGGATLGATMAWSATPPSGGVFADAAALSRARGRSDELSRFLRRADQAADAPIRPFVLADPAAIRFGWTERHAPPDDTLAEATDRLLEASATMRTLALSFALTGSEEHGARAEALILAWAREHTVVNVYDYAPDFAAGRLAGGTVGFASDRPWNFALDAMWQTYGAINVADALLLLRHGGTPMGAEAEDWLRRLLAAVNSSFHAWTRWADANDGRAADFHDPALPEPDRGVRRHRSDNHLSWALAGLLAGAAALDDRGIAAYALEGAVWDDGRSGPYANPSPLPAVIDRAIETEPPARGRIYEERIGREPPLTYALFHLEALTLAALVAERWFDRSVWGRRGAMLAAYERYGAMLRGERPAPGSDEAPNARWLMALTPPGFAGDAREALLGARALPRSVAHAIGPARLLFAAG